MLPRLAAVTGGTGFLGRYIVDALLHACWQVRALARGEATFPEGVEVVRGDLADRAALAALVRGAGAVVHAAGLVKARSRGAFMAVNRDGAARLGAAVGPGVRVVLVSSQAARCPWVSPYAQSKRAGEDAAVAALGGASWVVARPCVVYGPGDREGLALLRLAAGWAVPAVRPEPRIAMVHARDAAGAIVALCGGGPSGVALEVCDARADGYGWGELMGAVGAAVGCRPRLVGVPDGLVRLAGAAGEMGGVLSGRPAMFGRGKAGEFLHRDWGCKGAELVPEGLWRPRVGLAEGMAETVAWWRARGVKEDWALPPVPIPMDQAGHRNLWAPPPRPARGEPPLDRHSGKEG